MAIEAGARVGMVAFDELTVDYVKGRDFAPKGDHWEMALAQWADLTSDEDAVFDKVVEVNAEDIKPQVTWGTSPEMVTTVDGFVPTLEDAKDDVERSGFVRAYEYMGLKPGQAITDINLDRVFIGSCTNSRIEDLRSAAAVVAGRQVASNVIAIVVPGSGQVKLQAEKEGLDKVFTQAGLQWRSPGCSLCVAMNNDRLVPGERCASTSNRNFEGRQGVGGRTHLMSPAMAAAAAITGEITDVRKLL